MGINTRFSINKGFALMMYCVASGSVWDLSKWARPTLVVSVLDVRFGPDLEAHLLYGAHVSLFGMTSEQQQQQHRYNLRKRLPDPKKATYQCDCGSSFSSNKGLSKHKTYHNHWEETKLEPILDIKSKKIRWESAQVHDSVDN